MEQSMEQLETNFVKDYYIKVHSDHKVNERPDKGTKDGRRFEK